MSKAWQFNQDIILIKWYLKIALRFSSPWSGISRRAPFLFFFRVDVLIPVPRAPELKGRARGKPSLLAAARPMRAILPAPANVGRGSSMGLPRARQAFPLSGKVWDRLGRRDSLKGRGQEWGLSMEMRDLGRLWMHLSHQSGSWLFQIRLPLWGLVAWSQVRWSSWASPSNSHLALVRWR